MKSTSGWNGCGTNWKHDCGGDQAVEVNVVEEDSVVEGDKATQKTIKRGSTQL